MFRNVLLLGLLAVLPGCGVAESGGVDAADAQVIQALKEAGSNLSKPHPIDFYFVEFADRASAERFDRDWHLAHWKLDVHQMPGLSEWTVIASTVMVPDSRPFLIFLPGSTSSLQSTVQTTMAGKPPLPGKCQST